MHHVLNHGGKLGGNTHTVLIWQQSIQIRQTDYEKIFQVCECSFLIRYKTHLVSFCNFATHCYVSQNVGLFLPKKSFSTTKNVVLPSL